MTLSRVTWRVVLMGLFDTRRRPSRALVQRAVRPSSPLRRSLLDPFVVMFAASVPSSSVAPARARSPVGISDRRARMDNVISRTARPTPTRASRRVARISARHRAEASRLDVDGVPAAPEPARRAILGGVAATVGAWSLPSFAEDAAEAPTPPPPAKGAILVTGANSGVGLSAAKQLAAKGERVVLACRTEAKGEDARRAILDKVPSADLVVLKGAGLEMTDLRKVSDYCKAFLDAGIPLDTLILNAGIMAVPLDRTAQGHEMHFGVNHLAHFLVQDSLRGAMRTRAQSRGVAGRIVACSSIANMLPGAVDITDLDWRRREPKYEKWSAYAASKAENVLLTDEIARVEANDSLIVANSFHPGIVTTNLVRYILPELTAENRDPELERQTPQGKAMSKMGIRDADEGAKTHVWLVSLSYFNSRMGN